MAKLTTTYYELKELGACQDGLDTLWGWIEQNRSCVPGLGKDFTPGDPGCCKKCAATPLTPADILESNGREHLIWAVDHVRAWGKAYASWLDTLPIGADRGVEAWAKVVSAPKPLAKDLKGGDRIMFLGIERGVAGVYSKIGQITLNRVRGYTERFDLETLDAIGFTLIEPKREPRRLKAEQILVKENVGTKWRGTQGFSAVAEVRDCGYGVLRLEFIKTNEPAYVTSNTVAVWEEVIE